MKTVDRFVRGVQKVVPKAKIEVDEPRDSNGTWWLDVTHGSRHVIVDWRARRGFGISCSQEAGYGERPDEIHKTLSSAVGRTVELLKSKESTMPARDRVLRQIREEQAISQDSLAQLLGVSQASISKLERRDDMHVTALSVSSVPRGSQFPEDDGRG